MPDIIDSSELAKFREQWKAEVRQRKTLDVASSSTSSQDVSAVHEAREQSTPTASRTEATASYIRPNHPSVSAHTFKSLSSAVDIYRLAVQHEQSESLDDALRLYRHAFRLDTNVDKAYQKDELLAVRKLEEGSRADHDQHHNALSFDNSIGELDSWRLSSPQKINTHTGSLANIISSFSHELNFEPEDEKAGVPLRLLPDELLVLILRTLEPVSIERFALINKKARTLTLDPVIWRMFMSLLKSLRIRRSRILQDNICMIIDASTLNILDLDWTVYILPSVITFGRDRARTPGFKSAI
ncbi:hypothetical protein EW145_g6022 [Phellinidium pouzarii]|uniref:F-box domain-containing protein n=1 Tax=Phellinidium pouzarii TaxID=167371 RepID=A0A4S4KY09_9AGAM|nr:hypothetical protein EW145_g6022 [Phellinidium pouzarii]